MKDECSVWRMWSGLKVQAMWGRRDCLTRLMNFTYASILTSTGRQQDRNGRRVWNMARKNGVHVNGDNIPPASTLAAQIVQHQTRQVASQQPQARPQGPAPSFQDLLQEILHNQAAAQETDIHVNAQLVSVLIQGCLSPLEAAENPFSNGDELLEQAGNSIAVIGITITRQPDVLLTQLSQDGPLLFLDLLAALIALCGRSKCDVKGLLSSAIKAFQVSINVWQQARTVQEVIQECVDGMW